MTALITAGLLLKEVRPKCKLVEVREVASLCSETFLAITTGLVLCDTMSSLQYIRAHRSRQ